jgi:hypothetical protein
MSWGPLEQLSRWASLLRPGRARPGGSDRLAPWLPIAAAAHVALVLAVRGTSGQLQSTGDEAPTRDEAADSIVFELVADARERAAAPAPSKLDPAANGVPAPSAALASAAVDTGQRVLAARDARDVADVTPAALGSTPIEREASINRGLLDAADGEQDGATPRLSLRDLGVGGSNPFIGSPSELPTERQLQSHRLRQSLRADLARNDQRRGLGPEGPAVTAVKEIVLASATSPNTSALLRVRTDRAGAVTHVEVLEADRDDAEWQRIAERLRQALAGKRLRVPARSDGVSFQLRVVSRVQLPSGADPGLAIDLFGVPVEKGEGDKSTKISLISPMLREVTLPGSDGATILVPTINIFGAAGDLADIGAVARRLVTAYLVAMDTDVPLEGPAPADPVVQ